MEFSEDVWPRALRWRAVSQRSFWLVTDACHQPISNSSKSPRSPLARNGRSWVRWPGPRDYEDKIPCCRNPFSSHGLQLLLIGLQRLATRKMFAAFADVCVPEAGKTSFLVNSQTRNPCVSRTRFWHCVLNTKCPICLRRVVSFR